MQRTLLVLWALTKLTIATPWGFRPGEKSCGSLDSQLCANVSASQAPIEVRDDSYVTNTWEWYNWPTVLTWKAYQYTPDSGYVSAEVSCILYFHSVANYTLPCSEDNYYLYGQGPTLETYFDKGCEPPPRMVSGDVPKIPSTDGVNGTCDAARPLKNQHTFIGDQLGSGPINATQAQCGYGCKETRGCKSYYFANETTSPHFKEPYDVSQRNYPSGSQNIEDAMSAGICIYLSQPVSEITNNTFAFLDAFYDRNCPY
ncbi:hypothetical protein PRZ48_012950 [Zasmidium cellare]|uniref:Uncharacterized protein n=1 Tax=Zasmidium cellare TaxID=395010 RepID=A0ABR0E2M8_ZASCE|nr:hypothetical protein PRZ48_012950 [Zasmidium cellare]